MTKEFKVSWESANIYCRRYAKNMGPEDFEDFVSGAYFRYLTSGHSSYRSFWFSVCREHRWYRQRRRRDALLCQDLFDQHETWPNHVSTIDADDLMAGISWSEKEYQCLRLRYDGTVGWRSIARQIGIAQSALHRWECENWPTIRSRAIREGLR